jgi:hypothetical protein
MARWACALCETTAETAGMDEFPAEWHVVIDRPICFKHDDLPGTVALVRHLPRRWKMEGAGGMCWLTEVEGLVLGEVVARSSPRQAIIAWTQEYLRRIKEHSGD